MRLAGPTGGFCRLKGEFGMSESTAQPAQEIPEQAIPTTGLVNEAQNTPGIVANGSDIANSATLSTQDLRSITSFEDAQRLLADRGLTLRDATHELGDGFKMLEDKNGLLGTPFILIGWGWAEGDYKNRYVIARVVTSAGDKYIITDGGTGICAQMKDYEESLKGGHDPLMVSRGLRKSEYVNEHGAGVTFYLSV